jgi:hypothetical protein
MKPSLVGGLRSIIKQINMGVARLENYPRKAKVKSVFLTGRGEMGLPSREAYNENFSCPLFR